MSRVVQKSSDSWVSQFGIQLNRSNFPGQSKERDCRTPNCLIEETRLILPSLDLREFLNTARDSFCHHKPDRQTTELPSTILTLRKIAI